MPTHDARSSLSAPRRLAASVAAVVLAAAPRAFAQSCAMCASSFGQNDPVTRAFSWSILFLMAAPYSIVFTAAGWLFLAYRRTPGHRRASAADVTPLRQPALEVPGGDAS